MSSRGQGISPPISRHGKTAKRSGLNLMGGGCSGCWTKRKASSGMWAVARSLSSNCHHGKPQEDLRFLKIIGRKGHIPSFDEGRTYTLVPNVCSGKVRTTIRRGATSRIFHEGRTYLFAFGQKTCLRKSPIRCPLGGDGGRAVPHHLAVILKAQDSPRNMGRPCSSNPPSLS